MNEHDEPTIPRDTNHDPGRRNVLSTGTALGAAAVALGATGLAGTAAAQDASSAPGVLDGQVALVTGGARGIGRAIAVAMAEAGADVAVYDILADIGGFPIPLASSEDMGATRTAVEATGRRFLALEGDIRDLGRLREAVVEVEETLGPIDVLVANAGIGGNSPFLTDDQGSWDAHWELLTDVNVKGTAATLRAVAPGMAERGRGRIVITASTFGRQGNGSNPAYIASKWATVGMIKAAAIELGKSGITVNGIAPTAVRTLFGGEQSDEARANADEWLKANYHQLDVGILEPEDVAGSAVFLATPAAAMITGSCIDVSAGAAARYTA